MSEWSDGYVTEIAYTHGYFTEMNPVRARFALLAEGFEASPAETACELGFGQGVSAVIHGAASDTRWWGTDINPEQADHARRLGEASKSDIKLFDESFAEFFSRTDLPDFDYIALHGIWSWVSRENQFLIVDFIRRKLKPGGIVYISYNTAPGWAAVIPWRDLLSRYISVQTPAGDGIISRIDSALDFSEKLIAAEPNYLKANPAVSDRITALRQMDRHYLAHEYFNRDWSPMHFADLADFLSGAKLNYACSAVPKDDIELLNVSPSQKEILSTITDTSLKQTIRDFMVNRQFRKDYWIKGARKLSAKRQQELIYNQKIILTRDPKSVSHSVAGFYCSGNLTESVLESMLSQLSDYKPRKIGDIASSVGCNYDNLILTIRALISSGDIAPAAEPSKESERRCKALNAYLIEKTRRGESIGFLASPVTGGGIFVNRFDTLFAASRIRGCKTVKEMAEYLWKVLSENHEVVIKDGKGVQSPEENLAELCLLAETFEYEQRPILHGLGII